MITIHVEGESVREVIEQVAKELNLTLTYDAPAKQDAPVVVPFTAPAAAEPAPTPKKVGRPKKEASVEPTPPSPVPMTATEVLKSDLGPSNPTSFDQMKTALQTVDKDGGFEKAVSILAHFGYKRVKEVKPGDYLPILQMCEKA